MKDCLRSKTGVEMKREAEQGFMLVGLIVAIFFILVALSVAAPKVAQELRREREVEAIHRGDQYVRAIRVFYRKNGNYPGSIEQLEKTNNIRYLRQRYLDPMTGKDDWRLIHVGEAKTTVKGFFGQPLSGMAPGLGSASGLASGQATGQPSSGFGSSSTGTGGLGSPSAFGSSSGTSGLGSSGSAFGSSGSSGLPSLSGSSPTSGTSSSGSGTPNTLGSASGIASNQSSSGMPGTGGPFIGVGIPKEGSSITILNEQTTYNTWEFLYDPRIEQLYAKGALFGGGGLGSASGNSSGFGGAAPSSGFGSSPGSGFGSSPGSGYGSSPSSGFGSSPTSGFGSSPGTSTPTTPTTPPQQPQ
jgi:type II secretory pathway pseudopilin PulG